MAERASKYTVIQRKNQLSKLCRYAAGTPEFNPSTIEISGPDVYLKDISYAWVSFAAENITSSYTEEAVYKLMSEDGTECRYNGISSDYSTIESLYPHFVGLLFDWLLLLLHPILDFARNLFVRLLELH